MTLKSKRIITDRREEERLSLVYGCRTESNKVKMLKKNKRWVS